MTNVSHTPEFIVPGLQASLTFTLTEGGSNYVRVWCTVAPVGSRLDGLINSADDPRNRIQIFEGTPAQLWNTTFDKGGKYTFVAQEYIKGSGYGGGYEGDPNGADKEEKVGSEATLTVYVGQRCTQSIGPPDNRATIVLWVWNNTIKSTTKAFQGEETPAITAESPTPRVRTAIESTSVQTALAALVNETPADVIGDLTVVAGDYFDKYGLHHANSTVHIDSDQANYILDAWRLATTPKDLKDFVNRAIQMLRNHIFNDGSLDPAISGAGDFGPNSADYHFTSDRANIPLFETVGAFDEAYSGLADLRRCYAAHRLDMDAHSSDLDSHELEEPEPLLMQVHQAYHAVIASNNPTPPPGQTTGAQTLISGAGFTES